MCVFCVYVWFVCVVYICDMWYGGWVVCVVCGVCMYVIWAVQRWDSVDLSFTAVLSICIKILF